MCTTGDTTCFATAAAGSRRYCKTKETEQCKSFVPCPGYIPLTLAPTPTNTAGATLSAVDDTCVATVSVGDKDVGISAITDATCATTGGVGCKANSVCRYCKAKESTLASQFQWCFSLSLASVTTAPTPGIATTSSVPTCGSLVSAKNVDLGFSAISNAACKLGTVGGCF